MSEHIRYKPRLDPYLDPEKRREAQQRRREQVEAMNRRAIEYAKKMTEETGRVHHPLAITITEESIEVSIAELEAIAWHAVSTQQSRRSSGKPHRDPRLVDEIIKRRRAEPEKSGADIARDMQREGYGITERAVQRTLKAKRQ